MPYKVKGQHFRINNHSKLSLSQQTDGRWFIYLLKEGEKSKIVKTFQKDKHTEAIGYCESRAEIASRIRVKTKDFPKEFTPSETKVTLVEGPKPTIIQGLENKISALFKRVERLERELG